MRWLIHLLVLYSETGWVEWCAISKFPPVLGQVFVHILLWIFRGGPRPRGSSAAAVERGQMATGAVPLMTRIDLLGSFFFFPSPTMCREVTGHDMADSPHRLLQDLPSSYEVPPGRVPRGSLLTCRPVL